MQLQHNELRIYNISPVFYHNNKNNGRFTKIFLVYVANDYKENTYYVNSPYSELSGIVGKLKLQGYSNLFMELPYIELKSLKQLEKQKTIMNEYELEKVLNSEWNIIF